ncbi:MAG: LysM peptidoglycan-binding domain-containing protein [Chitinophagaceae bacterium]|nr:MAG: LysM peptidoglycan-binding domain-containing protein [Chitinophagaceae bacterium]
MRTFVLSLFTFFFANIVIAQNSELFIKVESKGFFVEHKAIAKDNFYSIGRFYNVHHRHLVSYNGLDFSKGIAIGQVVKIPLSDTNFLQSEKLGLPIFYKVLGNDKLNKIGLQFEVTEEKLREWNQFSGNKNSLGSKLIVGFLINKEIADQIATTEVKAKEFQEEKNEEVVVVNTPIVNVIESKVAESPSKSILISDKKVDSYFKVHFEQQIKVTPIQSELTVTSGIFKTETGWQDGKYYLLINNVEPGTVVRITNPSNNKIVFAKVLYAMEGIRQNAGLDIRISNATAAALEIIETDKFIVVVSY